MSVCVCVCASVCLCVGAKVLGLGLGFSVSATWSAASYIPSGGLGFSLGLRVGFRV